MRYHVLQPLTLVAGTDRYDAAAGEVLDVGTGPFAAAAAHAAATSPEHLRAFPDAAALASSVDLTGD